jgi:hypothetical protein
MAENNHCLTIYARERLDVNDALEVLSSTEKEVYVQLSCEVLQILGEQLKINKLIPEEKSLCVVGKITGVNYISKLNKKSFFKKVFK